MVDVNETAFAAAASQNKWQKRQSQKDKLGGLKNDKSYQNDLDVSDRIGTNKNKKYRNKQKTRKIKAERNVQRTSDVEKINAAKLPKTSADLSSNWKKLLQQMEEQKQRPYKVVGKDLSNNDSSRNSVHTKMAETRSVKRNKIVKQNVKETKSNGPKIWFDNVEKCFLDQEIKMTQSDTPQKITDHSLKKLDPLIKDKSFEGLTKAISIDCEMVGVGYKGEESVLARVSLVNHFGHCIYDKYVKPREKVTDYRTAVSGIRPQDIDNANEFKCVQKEVSDIISNRVLVGHAIRHDLKVTFHS